jgi:hypothetical protein
MKVSFDLALLKTTTTVHVSWKQAAVDPGLGSILGCVFPIFDARRQNANAKRANLNSVQ